MSKPDILAAMKEVEGQILSWNQNIRESMKYIESRFADFHSKAISDNSSCGSIKPHVLHLKPQFSSQTAAATIPNSSLSPPLPFNAPPKQTSSQSSFEELIKKIEAKIAANAITPPPQPEPSGDTQVVTTATSVTIFQEEQLAAKIVDVSNNPCETKRIVYAPEMRVVRYVHKVFDELTEMDSSSPEEVAASGALRKNSYIFIEEKKAGDSSTDKIGHISIQRELSLAGGEKIQVYMNEKWANLHIAPAATLTDYFKKKGTETLRVFDPGGSAFDARVREAGNSLFGVFYFSCFKMKWVSTKVHDWMRDSFSSYCDTALNYLAARLRMNRKVILCNVVTKSIALGVVGCNICWLNVICLVRCFKNVLSVWPLARSLTVSFKGILVELLVWKWLKMVKEHACKLTHCLLLVSVGLFVCLRCYLSAVIICMTWLLPQWIGGTIGVDIAILQLLNLKGIRKLSVQEVTVGG